MSGRYRECDKSYGDIQISGVSPSMFLSLIFNSKCIMTDSFHAICFSYMFKKDFYVFKRLNGEHMNSRISDILYTLNCSDRYVESIDKYNSINYDLLDKSLFSKVYNDSISFIDRMVAEIENEE